MQSTKSLDVQLSTFNFQLLTFNPARKRRSIPKHPLEDGRQVAQFVLGIEKRVDFFAAKYGTDIWIVCDELPEIRPFVPHLHGVALDPEISLLTQHPFSAQRQQQRRRVEKSSGNLEVGLHLLRVHRQPAEDPVEPHA